MRERATLLGGSVELTESPLGGTRVAAHLPWGGVA
jgi:signal transduction histidine kinase